MHDSLLSPQLFLLGALQHHTNASPPSDSHLDIPDQLLPSPFLKDVGQIQHSYSMRAEKRPGFAEPSVDAFLQGRQRVLVGQVLPGLSGPELGPQQDRSNKLGSALILTRVN